MILQAYPLDYWLDAIGHFATSEEPTPPESNDDEHSNIDKRSAETLQKVFSESEASNIEEFVAKKSAGKFRSEGLIEQPAHALVVQNKIDLSGSAFLNQSVLKERFPFIHDFASISLHPQKAQRLEVLQTLFKEMLEKMPIVGAPFPRSIGITKAALED
ncbi:MAG: hypothetical protein IPP17_00660 [Bacteroidetes bacterium]|nr:hypothetical protein [Bacteroidota bacterium]